MTDPAPDPDETDGTVDDAARKARREAKNLRERLREVEAERDALTDRVQTFERDTVMRTAVSAGLADGDDLWRDGLTLDDLRDDDGQIDETKLTEAVSDLLERRPHYAAPPKTPPIPGKPTERMRGGGRPDEPAVSSWSRVLSEG